MYYEDKDFLMFITKLFEKYNNVLKEFSELSPYNQFRVRKVIEQEFMLGTIKSSCFFHDLIWKFDLRLKWLTNKSDGRISVRFLVFPQGFQLARKS